MVRKNKKQTWNYIVIERNGATLYLKYKGRITWTNSLGYPFPDASIEENLDRVKKYGFPDARIIQHTKEEKKNLKSTLTLNKELTIKGPAEWEQEEFQHLWDEPKVRKKGRRNRIKAEKVAQEQEELLELEDQPEGVDYPLDPDWEDPWDKYGIYAKCQNCTMNCKQHGGVTLYRCDQYDPIDKKKSHEPEDQELAEA